jgi:mono/diheme cytochrome c family protein
MPVLVLVGGAVGGEAAGASTGPRAELIDNGEYLVRAGDCIAGHTAPAGKLFAGGRAMPTPFGTLYTSNITPDNETGIGSWTGDQFYKMMHTGRFPDGGLLYPAMPFSSYTKVTRADSDAIFAYLKSIPPVKQANRPHDLRFPYNNRALILGWRTLFFTEGEFKPELKQSDEWNRGAYLVQGLGHCAMCHTAINALGGSSESQAFEGGLIPMQNWYAPSLTSNKEAGLGDWSIKDITDLLKTGVSARGVVYGPMAEVVQNSLKYLTDADLQRAYRSQVDPRLNYEQALELAMLIAERSKQRTRPRPAYNQGKKGQNDRDCKSGGQNQTDQGEATGADRNHERRLRERSFRFMNSDKRLAVVTPS